MKIRMGVVSRKNSKKKEPNGAKQATQRCRENQKEHEETIVSLH